MKIAVIGVGNMGQALLKSFVTSGMFDPSDVNICDCFKAKVDELCALYNVNGYSEASLAVKDCDYVLVAVKPVNFDDTVKSFKDSLKEGSIVLSIAAAVKCERIKNLIGDRKFVRIMPNTPAQVGAGVSALCPVGLNDEEKSFTEKLFKTCGEVVLCDEKTLDAIGCVSGTGPAYVMLFIEAMADAACALGIKRDDALKIAAGTVMGSGKLCLETGKHPGVLKDQVCSPGGTTIAGVMALEENGLRNAVIKAVLAADEKTKEMSK